MSGSARELAKKLGAADARNLIQTSLPYVLEQLTSQEIDQLQRVMDAAVVNPYLLKEEQQQEDSIIRKEGAVMPAQGGDTDEDGFVEIGGGGSDEIDRIHAARHRYHQRRISVREDDRRVMILSPSRLLVLNALTPLTDNPDEARYLHTILSTLNQKFVYLQLTQNGADGKNWDVMLTLGPFGARIPTSDGRLTRDGLLSMNVFANGYYDHVIVGGTQRRLNQLLSRASIEIEGYQFDHKVIADSRRGNWPGVVAISDLMGGANFPGSDAWLVAAKDLTKAYELNVGGNVKKSTEAATIALVEIQIASQKLSDYLKGTQTGAQRAVTCLHVAQVAGEVAGDLLLLATGLELVNIVREGAAAAAATRSAAYWAGRQGVGTIVQPSNAEMIWETATEDLWERPTATTAGRALGRADIALTAKDVHETVRDRGANVVDTGHEVLEGGAYIYDKIHEASVPQAGFVQTELTVFLSSHPNASLEEKMSFVESSLSAHSSAALSAVLQSRGR